MKFHIKKSNIKFSHNDCVALLITTIVFIIIAFVYHDYIKKVQEVEAINQQVIAIKYDNKSIERNTDNQINYAYYHQYSAMTISEPVHYEALYPECTYTISFSVPNYDTNFKAYEDYRCITDTTTKQWELQQQAYTDEQGMRKIDDCYLVAMGSYYTNTIGDKFKITLEDGTTFNVMVGDFKQNIHTNVTNQYSAVYYDGSLYSANVLEFIVDEYVLDNQITNVYGTVSYYDTFNGNIKKIEKYERNDYTTNDKAGTE